MDCSKGTPCRHCHHNQADLKACYNSRQFNRQQNSNCQQWPMLLLLLVTQYLTASQLCLDGRALDMLEAELATICPIEGQLPQTYRSNQEQDLHKLRLLLERECAAQVCMPMCAWLNLPCSNWTGGCSQLTVRRSWYKKHMCLFAIRPA